MDFLYVDLRQPSGATAEDLDRFTEGTPLHGWGAYFVAAEKKYHVSARYLLAHAILESAWGRSELARQKNNLFGFRAYDRDPYNSAMMFQSWGDCIDYVARYVARNYLTPGGQYYHGPTLAGMNQSYATDPEWGRKIANIMAQIHVSGPQGIKVLVSNQEVALGEMRDDVVWAPVRAVAEALGGRVEWDEENQTVRITKEV